MITKNGEVKESREDLNKETYNDFISGEVLGYYFRDKDQTKEDLDSLRKYLKDRGVGMRIMRKNIWKKGNKQFSEFNGRVVFFKLMTG